MFQFDYYSLCDSPSWLIIFLHGYNDCPQNHRKYLEYLMQKSPNSCIIAPKSNKTCDKNPHQNQWFGMLSNDPDNKRISPDTPVSQIFDIYQRAEKDIDDCASKINRFINTLQQKYHIDNNHTYLIGFSQGAMLALYTALSRTATLAGVFSLSGLIAGKDKLAKKISSTPKTYIFHGKKDNIVQYKTLSFTIEWLETHGVISQIFTYDELSHRLSENEFNEISKIINTASL